MITLIVQRYCVSIIIISLLPRHLGLAASGDTMHEQCMLPPKQLGLDKMVLYAVSFILDEKDIFLI